MHNRAITADTHRRVWTASDLPWPEYTDRSDFVAASTAIRRGNLWGHPDFLRLWFGQSVSNLGDRISLLALPTIALVGLHQGALAIGVIGSLRFLPFLVLSPVAGGWADRLTRQRIMITADLGRFLSLLTIPLGYALGALTIWQLYAVALVNGCLTVFFEVSYQSYLPTLVEPGDIMEGNAKLQMTRSGSQAVGSALGGLLISLISSAGAVIVDAMSFIVSALSIGRIKARELPPSERPPAGSARDGWIALKEQPVLRSLLASSTVSNLGYSMGTVLALVIAYQELHLSPGEVGLATGVGGVGFVLGAMAAKRITSRFRVGRTIALMPLLIAVGNAVLPLGHLGLPLLVLCVGQFLVGAATSVYNVPVMTLVMTLTPPTVRGRIIGMSLILVWGAVSLGSLVGGVLGSLMGGSHAILVGAVFSAAATVIALASPVARVAAPPGPPAPPAASTAEPPTEAAPAAATADGDSSRQRDGGTSPGGPGELHPPALTAPDAVRPDL